MAQARPASPSASTSATCHTVLTRSTWSNQSDAPRLIACTHAAGEPCTKQHTGSRCEVITPPLAAFRPLPATTLHRHWIVFSCGGTSAELIALPTSIGAAGGIACISFEIHSQSRATRRIPDASTSMLHVRLDDQLKTDAAEKLAHVSLTVSDAVRILLTRVAKGRRLASQPSGRPETAVDIVPAKVQEALDDTRPAVPHRQVMDEARALIDEKRRALLGQRRKRPAPTCSAISITSRQQSRCRPTAEGATLRPRQRSLQPEALPCRAPAAHGRW